MAVRRGHHAVLRGLHYAVVKTSVVESWPRVTSKRISADPRAVAQGAFFSRLEHPMTVPGQDMGGGRVAGYKAGEPLTRYTVRCKSAPEGARSGNSWAASLCNRPWAKNRVQRL
jgi:hypothetical protein